MRTRLTTLTVALALTLAACGSADSTPEATGTDVGASTTTTSPSAPTTPDASPSGGQDSDAGNLEETETASNGSGHSFTTDNTQGGTAQGGGDLLPVEVRTGEHGAVTRVVIEFRGETEPGWAAGYVDEAVEAGRGDVIDVPGSATLAVTVRGLAYPENDQQIQAMVSGDITPSTGRIAGLHLDPMFEGQATLFIGLDSVDEYEVFTLGDPQRVVVDIRTN